MAVAGSIVATSTDLGGLLTKISIAWTASAGGAVSGTTVTVPAGRVRQAKFVSGTPAPTTAYDVTVLDADGADILGGGGANIVSPGANYAVAAAPIYCEGGAVTPTVANAGNAAAGTIDLYIGP